MLREWCSPEGGDLKQVHNNDMHILLPTIPLTPARFEYRLDGWAALQVLAATTAALGASVLAVTLLPQHAGEGAMPTNGISE